MKPSVIFSSVLLAVSVLVIVSANSGNAGVVRVPGDHTTIQAGINAASIGDTVLVAPGIYTGDGNRDIGFGCKVVMSEKGPEATIIDCEADSLDQHRGVYFGGNQEEDTVLDGFTIRNGYSSAGGGIRCYYSGPTIKNCIITGNTSLSNGGGIDCFHSCLTAAPTIINCRITGNTANSGGGIYCWEGMNDHYPTIVGNTIANNTATNRGGGIYCWGDTNPEIDGNTFTGNSAAYGGAVYVGIGCNPTVTNSILWDDIADYGQEVYVQSGGSISITYSDVTGGWTGTGNINSDPCFLLPDLDDYRLLWESPCIDAGRVGDYDHDVTRKDMGACCFDQAEYLTLYITPDVHEISRGSQLGVTYTFINRWSWAEHYWLLSQVILPNGSNLNVVGPERKSTGAWTTSQIYETHYIPTTAPLDAYEYVSRIGIPPTTLYGEDGFNFRVVP